eukprot:CAMPEP_0197070364 /NCGR_PEP_ID=MMETSP1384-20130603/199431_1 /TAXON_ID=29189 /ORGANISM="Ammonia sp." /LENGTH=52 /DNA_ID=CAMNT_0042508707 /DNA_START=27 /DNA_END=182 /DNA_ORIENTATION=+
MTSNFVIPFLSTFWVVRQLDHTGSVSVEQEAASLAHLPLHEILADQRLFDSF